MFGAKTFDGVGFPTPSSVPDDWACRLFAIPADAAWLGTFMGLLETLMDEEAWQQFGGGISREDAAAIWAEIVASGYASAETYDNACAGPNLSPFWDDADGADADGSPDDNTYTWSERLADWAIAAFVATSATPGAAVTYLTIAPRFRLAFKTGDWGGIVNILLDDDLVTTVDTYSAEPGLMLVDIVVPAA